MPIISDNVNNDDAFNNFCEPCEYSPNIIITLSKDDLLDEEEIFEIVSWGAISGDFQTIQNSHSMPNNDIGISGLKKNPPSFTISNCCVSNRFMKNNDLQSKLLNMSSVGVGYSSALNNIIGSKTLSSINNVANKATSTLLLYYNTLEATKSTAKKIGGLFGFGDTTNETTKKLFLMIECFFSKYNGKFNLYCEGIKFKHLSLSSSFNKEKIGEIYIDITATYSAITDIEPSFVKSKLPFIKGMSGAKEKLTSTTEDEPQTLLKSLFGNIKLF